MKPWRKLAALLLAAACSGDATAPDPAPWTVTASAPTGLSARAAGAVGDGAAAVLVRPPQAIITGVGDTLRLAALAFDENGYAVSAGAVSWASDDVSVATVDAEGLVTAIAGGTATVTASAGAVSGAAEIVVLGIADNGTDRDVLVALYVATGGLTWETAENWLTDRPIQYWHGVNTAWIAGAVRVVGLDLGRNGLTGPVPPELGSLTNLRELNLGWNGLTGPIPPELGGLTNLRELNLGWNDLTGSIPPELGSLTELRELNLRHNGLTGPIPPELGGLTELRVLWLADNRLTGPIPPELGGLTKLTRLALERNGLTGPIPPELGGLTELRDLWLGGNGLTGPIPPELGGLTELGDLWLVGSSLTGPIPPELGGLTKLTQLALERNGLTGPVPPELGGLTELTHLNLDRNAGMAGVLPMSLTNLRALEEFRADGTGLCAPVDPDFQIWLAELSTAQVQTCIDPNRVTYPAYLTQAAQSREFPVPLVAGEKALLRVFVTAASPTEAATPPLRARFFAGGDEIYRADIPARTAAIPTELYEGDLSQSQNAVIPGGIVRRGLEMVVEIDTTGIDPGLGIAARIPETGRMAIDVREMPALDLTVIPFLWRDDPHWEVVETVEAMAADPQGHEMLRQIHDLLPVGEIRVTAHAPVLTSTSYDEWGPILGQTEAIRAIEGGTGHYMGTMSRPGREGQAGAAYLGGRVFISRLNPTTMAHELGHNMGLYHAPACGAGGADPNFPTNDGSVGVWGYDFRYGNLVPPNVPDLMGYCDPSWIGGYHFGNALRFRLSDEGGSAAAAVAGTVSGQSLLLWGGVDAGGAPYLQPAFVLDAPAAVPARGGEYEITGRDGRGGVLFSLTFRMPATVDGDGGSSFAFVLPVLPWWRGRLASITLSGPGGSATLNGESDHPMTILRGVRGGQVRGFLRGLPLAAQAASDGTATPGLDVLVSRGIPDPATFRPPR